MGCYSIPESYGREVEWHIIKNDYESLYKHKCFYYMLIHARFRSVCKINEQKLEKPEKFYYHAVVFCTACEIPLHYRRDY